MALQSVLGLDVPATHLAVVIRGEVLRLQVELATGLVLAGLAAQKAGEGGPAPCVAPQVLVCQEVE